MNRHHFTGDGLLVSDLFFGFWFDSFSIAACNILFICLSVLPPLIFVKAWFQTTIKWLFVFTNAIFLAFNLIDVAYFPFTRKRSTVDLFEQMGGQSDIISLLPQFFSGFIFLMLFLYKRTKKLSPIRVKETGLRNSIVLILTFFLTFLALRGGLQRSPIDIVNAGAVTGPGRAPIVLNTPFTLIKSLDQHALPEYRFFPENELKKIYDPVHNYHNLQPKRLNVVVLLLESFSKEYCALGGKKSFTPFFDSLMENSLVFTNGFSNSSKSIEGIPAVLSSLPSYMEIPFINSMYSNNAQTSFASLLTKEGYLTAFFHGGSNGTMNFTEWSAAAGYQSYFGRNEYNNESDYDGYWGIWDEPFLQFSVDKMSGFPQPFHSAVFTLSSHHPYRVPEKYRDKFPEGKEDFEAALRYADYSLSRFFNAASRTKWYDSTLFVMVADHAIVSDQYLDNPLANFTIPVAFYRPDNSLKGKNTAVFFQDDVLPQALQLIGYNKPFFSFGKDPSKTRDHLGCYFGNGYYTTFTDSMMIGYVDTNTLFVYNYLRDSALRNNIMGKHTQIEGLIGRNFRALLQTYNHTMNSNTGKIEE